jgi:chromosome partitioning protein
MDSFEPLILVVGGVKGGIGKSTIAINLGFEWMLRGRRSLLIDADPQGTTLTLANVAAEAGVVAPTVIAMGDNIRQAVPDLAKAAEVTIIDTAGRLGKRFGSALMVADVALLPCRPNPADIWALADTVDAVQAAQALRPELLAYIVLNGVEVRTTLSRDARENIAAAGLPVLTTRLFQRVAFAEACATGKGVTAYQPKSPAAAEIRALVDELETLTGRSISKSTSRRKAAPKKGVAV